ncbi:MAG: hypothetical protein KAR23_06300, partial [Candidatus Aenigmarchaeota archaeon]|nr:hypothetical protein [Candidatus Aenigmarchaeota archaeon]
SFKGTKSSTPSVTTVRIISSPQKKSVPSDSRRPLRDRAAKTITRAPRRSFEDRPAPASRKSELTAAQKRVYKEQLNELIGTHAASIYDKNNTFAGRVPVKNIEAALKQVAEPLTVIIDAEVDKDLCRIVESSGADNIIAMKMKDKAGKVNVITQEDL